MTGTEKNLYYPHDEMHQEEYYAPDSAGGETIGQASSTKETVDREAAQSLGHAATTYARTGKPYMGGMDYRDVVL
jgi:hypothetical protein